ncbi:response regulator [Fulvivirga sedimenti]|uniref:Response regulator n=1 Tax=Fulvivirga sedimenti TaxID=2879465 RepID=A0A9X1KWA7_9BACT|nr:response regulator [Fulvivirga sedimenti]MCA6073789.1 response regulator [Fulvivirga sedimenti]
MTPSKYILIIDDDLDIVHTIKDQIFSVFGTEFKYETAGSGEEGISLVKEIILEEIDILITISDWLMPGMKGDEFLITLHKIVPDAIKIMITGHATEDAIQRAYKEANLYQLFAKPWNKNELISAIKKQIED